LSIVRRLGRYYNVARRLLDLDDETLNSFLGGSKASTTGIAVTPLRALQHPPFLSIARLVAGVVASLPCVVYRRTGPEARERDPDHPTYRVVHDQPNEEMDSFIFWETTVFHIMHRGKSCARIDRNGKGQVTSLWPYAPDRVKAMRGEKGKLIYRYTPPRGGPRYIPLRKVLYISNLSGNGLTPYDPLWLLQNPLALGIAAEDYAGKIFKDGSLQGGFLRHPKKLGRKGRRRLKRMWKKTHGGLDNAHETAVLEDGMEWQDRGVTPEQAQLLAVRRHQLQETARGSGMSQMHLLGDLERATFDNIEHQSLEFVIYCLRILLRRIERRVNIMLFTPEEQKTHFIEFLVDELLRGDIKSRFEALAIAHEHSVINADEWRRKENMPPQPGGQGKIYQAPINKQNAMNLLEEEPGEESSSRQIRRSMRRLEARVTAATGRQKLAKAYRDVFANAGLRIVKRERNDILPQAEKAFGQRDLQSFLVWLEQFYQEHREYIRKQMGPVISSFAEAVRAAATKEIDVDPEEGDQDLATFQAFVQGLIEGYANRHSFSSEGQIRQVLAEAIEKQEEPTGALRQRFDEWEEKRPGKIATRETVQQSNAVAKKVFVMGGIVKLRWVTIGKNCPFCNILDNRVVGVEETFVDPGDFTGSDGTALRVRRPVGHPPLHAGCDCQIRPEV